MSARLLRALWAGSLGAALAAQGINPTLIQPATGEAKQKLRATGTAALTAKAAPAIVHIAVEVIGTPTPFQIERPGSGVIVDASGLVLTWLSLVHEAVGKADKQIVVKLGDEAKTRLLAKVHASDEASGLCLLSLDPPAAPLHHLELAATAHFADGEPTLVLGLPDGKDPVAFAGVASHSPIAVRCAGKEQPPANLVLTDARIDRRCHGSALLDATGRLLGLCNAEHVRRDVGEPTLEDLKASSFGFALAADVARTAFAEPFAAAKVKNATLLRPPAADAARDRARLEGTAAAVARCRTAVVSVWGGEGKRPPAASADDPYSTRRREQLGSGVVVSATGRVLTNRHLVRDQAITVTLSDGRTFPAEVVAGNAPTNIALLQLTLPAGTKLTAIDCGSDQDAILGETLIAIGNPSGTTPTISIGVLSAKRRGGRIQADPNLGNHNGGGALVDLEGRLVAICDGGTVDPINVAFAERGDDTKTESNLSTAVGIDAIRKLFPSEVDLPLAPGNPERRQTPTSRAVAACASAMLNVYVSFSTAAADAEANPFAEHKAAATMVRGLGSGLIIDPSGLALSNWHVVEAATNPDGSSRKDHAVHARTFDNRTFQVRVLSISREDDLALLQLQLDPGATVPAVEIGDSDALQVGEQVLAIGNPHGFANTITAGIVAAKNQDIQVKRRFDKLRHMIETDAAINAGNSGGALLDLSGSLVGINSAGSGGFSLQGYAIPANHVRKQVLELLLSPYKLRSPDLGIKVGDRKGLATILAVDLEGPGHRAGLLVDDAVLAVDGKKIEWSPAFAMALLRADPARDLDLTIQRQGKQQQVKLRPLAAATAVVQRQTGLELATLTFQEAPDAVRKAAIAAHRRFTNNPTAEPATIRPSLVRIARIHPLHQPPTTDLKPGDLLLGVEVTSGGELERLQPFLTVDDVKDLCNDPARSSYDGADFTVWLWRDNAVRTTTLRGKRLLW